MNTKKHLQTILPKITSVWVYLSGFVTKRPKTAFIIKFLIFSIVSFILWTQIGKYYTLSISHVSHFILKGMGYNTTLHYNGGIIFKSQQGDIILGKSIELINFNIASFLALIMATPLIRTHRILKSLTWGLPILFLFHVINLVSHFPLYYDGQPWARTLVSLSGITNMALPFILWIAFTYDFIIEAFIPEEKFYRCPLCGEKKIGIHEHLTTVHLKRNKKEQQKVNRFIDNHPTLKRKKHP